MIHSEQNCKRDRSDSLDRAYGASPSLAQLVWETETFLPGSRERQESLELMHSVLVERSKQMRTGPGPGSLKQADDSSILDAYFTGNDASGSLDHDTGASGLGFTDHLQYDLHDRFPDYGFGGRKGGGGGGSEPGFFAMDDVGSSEQALSSSFKESVSFGPKDGDSSSLHGDDDDCPPRHHAVPSAILPDFSPVADPPAAGPAAAAAAAAAAAVVVPVATRPNGTGKNRKASPMSDEDGQTLLSGTVTGGPTKAGGGRLTAAAAMLGSTPVTAAMAAAMPAGSILSVGGGEEGGERLSHKEVEQRRREKAKLYFDELRALLPCGAESKFDKNTILQNTIAMIKQLQAELDYQREMKPGAKRSATLPTSHDYRASFDVTRQPLCFCGLDGVVWHSNAAFCNLLGYPKSEADGLSLLSSTASSDSDASSQHWQRLISSGMCNSAFYCHLIRKDSQQVMVNMDLNLIHKRNQPYCFLVAVNPTS